MKALITGINGQDGSYLTELLLGKGYQVWGTLKRNSVAETQIQRINHLFDNSDLHLLYADTTDMASMMKAMKASQPDEIYHLAAQSHVGISFEQPIYTTNTIVMGILNMLEGMQVVCPDAKFYHAGSSEQFGITMDEDGYQRETTPMVPTSPYGCSKVFAFNLVRNYRVAYNMFATNGILFNHESVRRGTNFVTAKIARGAVNCNAKPGSKLALGNLEAKRDWGHSDDYVRGMWMMMQQDKPDDYVLATGVTRSVRDVCEYVFGRLDMDYRDHVTIDKRYMRAEELPDLRGDASKAQQVLGWTPNIGFEEMMDEMVEYWLREL